MDELTARLNKKSRGLLKTACSNALNRIRQAHFAKWVVCEVDSECITRVYEAQGGLCAITGEELNLVAGTPTSMSVVRVDVEKSYQPGNIMLVVPFVRDAVESFGWIKFRRMCGRAIEERV